MKFIIQNNVEWLSQRTALELCTKVVNMGFISTGTYGKQYCHITTWTIRDKTIAVSAYKRKSGTHKFIILEDKK